MPNVAKLSRTGAVGPSQHRPQNTSGAEQTARALAPATTADTMQCAPGPMVATASALDKGREPTPPAVIKMQNQLREATSVAGFERCRGFSQYAHVFGRDFEDALSKVQQGRGIWLDGGAGEGHAVKQWMAATGCHGKAIAVDFYDPNHSPVPDGPPRNRGEHVIVCDMETFKVPPGVPPVVITDVFGALSYTGDLNAVLETYLEALPIGGELFVALGKTEVLTRSGQWLDARRWFEGLEGLRAERPRGGVVGSVRIIKQAKNVTIPRLRLMSVDTYDRCRLPFPRAFQET